MNKVGGRLLLGGALSCLSCAAFAASLEFECRADGKPFSGPVDFSPADEYDALGVVFRDSGPSPDGIHVNLANPVNAGTAISGYHVSVGAFASVPTSLQLEFDTDVKELSFDFATPRGEIRVRAFDALDNVIAHESFAGTDTFVLQTGFTMPTGHASMSFSRPIDRVAIEPVLPNGSLLLDNLDFAAERIEVAVSVNPVDGENRGVVAAAILGAPDFDVASVDPTTVRLHGVPPQGFRFEDVAAFSTSVAARGACVLDGTGGGLDGRVDLTLEFDAGKLGRALGDIQPGDPVTVRLTGRLREEFGATPVRGEDAWRSFAEETACASP